MVCKECERLNYLIDKCRSLESDKKEYQTLRDLHHQHADILIGRCEHNLHKAIESEESNPDAPAFHLSLNSDGVASDGLRFLPHKHLFHGGGTQRCDLLKIHTEFTMVHNHGTYAHVSLPDLETTGGDMTLNSIFRAVYLALRSKQDATGQRKQIKTLFLCLDNTVSSNKCWAVLRGLGSLVALGVAEKVKLVYRLVGHTKSEVDQTAGIVSRAIQHQRLLTPDAWRQALLGAVQEGDPSYTIVEADFMTGCPKYSSSLRDAYGDYRVRNLTRVKVVRIAMHPTENRVEYHYKSDPRVSGWFPRYMRCIPN